MTTGPPSRKNATNRTCLLVALVCLFGLALFIVAALFSWGTIRYLPAHIALTRSPVFMIRQTGCGALAAYKTEPERTQAIEALVVCLHDDSMWVRLTAVGSLDDLHATESAAALRPLIADPDGGVRTAAIWTLGQWADPVLLESLLAWASHPPEWAGSPPVKSYDNFMAASELLGNYPDDPRVLPALRKLVQGPDAVGARGAVDSLAKLNTPETWRLIEQAAQRNDMGGEEAQEALAKRATPPSRK